jgi:8-oxo-dGTP diphosphatase
MLLCHFKSIINFDSIPSLGKRLKEMQKMLQRPRVVVGIIVTKGDQILLLKRNKVHGSGTWCAPAGHLEFGESIEECAIRETKEETNVVICDIRFRAITNNKFEKEGKHYVTIWMEGNYMSGEAVINSASEVAAVSWFNWDELPKPLFLPFENLLHNRCYPSESNET